jgi:hypothetical protein
MATREFQIKVHPAICRCTNLKHGHGGGCEREEVSSADHLCRECHEIEAANAMEQIHQDQGNASPVNPTVYHHGGTSKVGG